MDCESREEDVASAALLQCFERIKQNIRTTKMMTGKGISCSKVKFTIKHVFKGKLVIVGLLLLFTSFAALLKKYERVEYLLTEGP